MWWPQWFNAQPMVQMQFWLVQMFTRLENVLIWKHIIKELSDGSGKWKFLTRARPHLEGWRHQIKWHRTTKSPIILYSQWEIQEYGIVLYHTAEPCFPPYRARDTRKFVITKERHLDVRSEYYINEYWHTLDMVQTDETKFSQWWLSVKIIYDLSREIYFVIIK